MAKCKDCSAEIGFLKKRCASCEEKFKAAEVERKAHEEKIATEQAKLAAEKRELDAIERAKANLSQTWDKFEQKGNIEAKTFKSEYGDAKFQFSCVNKKTWWLVATQSQDDWDWLENNRTIILFDEDNRFIQDHGQLRSTDVGTNWADQVKCFEEHHINITSAIPYFLNFYEDNKLGSEYVGVPLRIGRHEYKIPLKEIRSIAAISAVISE